MHSMLLQPTSCMLAAAAATTVVGVAVCSLQMLSIAVCVLLVKD